MTALTVTIVKSVPNLVSGYGNRPSTAAAPSDNGLPVRDILLLRLGALMAMARGDEIAYRDCRDRYRAMATELGFEGHMTWAEAMP